MRIEGARVLVAGGAHRVGRAVALDLAAAGADVCISYHRSQDAAREPASPIEAPGGPPGPVLMPEGVRGDSEETVLGRLGDPADVAQAIRYCIEADFFTGQNLIVDGGRLLR